MCLCFCECDAVTDAHKVEEEVQGISACPTKRNLREGRIPPLPHTNTRVRFYAFPLRGRKECLVVCCLFKCLHSLELSRSIFNPER